MAGKNLNGAMGSLLMFFICLLSYRPIKVEINTLVNASNTTNAILDFFNSWFGLFWAFLCVMFIALTIYIVINAT